MISRSKRWVLVAMVVALLALVMHAVPMLAADQAPAPPSGAAPGGHLSWWGTIAAGGVIAYLIIVMSLVAVALVIEHFLSIRREQLIPGPLVSAMDELLAAKDYRRAQDVCAADGSYLAQVIGSGLNQIGAMFGFFDMQSAMQEVSERQVSKLYRKLEYLSFIAATAPMLGLLGTVTGMIRSFNKIALAEGTARPSQLAGGISEALITTCLGLVVAIPTMFFVAFFRNRIDGYVAEAETIVEKLMGRFRKETPQ